MNANITQFRNPSDFHISDSLVHLVNFALVSFLFVGFTGSVGALFRRFGQEVLERFAILTKSMN